MRSVREYIEIEGVEYISWPLYGVRSWAGVDPAGRKDRVLLTAWKESGERWIKLVGFGRWDRRWRFAGVSLRRVAINFLLRVWNTWWIREMDFDSWVRIPVWMKKLYFISLYVVHFHYCRRVNSFQFIRRFVIIENVRTCFVRGDFKFHFFGR